MKFTGTLTNHYKTFFGIWDMERYLQRTARSTHFAGLSINAIKPSWGTITAPLFPEKPRSYGGGRYQESATKKAGPGTGRSWREVYRVCSRSVRATSIFWRTSLFRTDPLPNWDPGPVTESQGKPKWNWLPVSSRDLTMFGAGSAQQTKMGPNLGSEARSVEPGKYRTTMLHMVLCLTQYLVPFVSVSISFLFDKSQNQNILRHFLSPLTV